MKLTSVLITGTSTGLGQALVAHYLKQGAQVYGLSRSGSRISHLHLRDARIDLGDLNTLKTSLAGLLEGIDQLDLVILNAGLLGQIEPMRTLEMDSLKDLMDVNVWSNKLLLDYMGENEIKVQQVVAISSGAAVNGNKGWGAYSLSKAALNMLIKLYAAEHQDTHFTALAPGLVDTRMQDYLCDPAKVDEGEFSSVMKLRQARGSQAMPEPEVAAANIAAVLPEIKNSLQSGDFVDMRNL